MLHVCAMVRCLPSAPVSSCLPSVQDGRNWARIEADHHTHALFDCGGEGEWDSVFIAGPQVLAAAPKDMRLYYHSFDVSQERFRVGLATSEDGFRY